MIIVKLSEVIYIESVGKDVYVNTMDKRYKVKQRLYNLEMLLPQDDFIRISNGVIIERGAIERIRPALSCRF
nr:LytTR family transcriptional regulator [Lachnospiraceae bacterium]